MSLSPWRFRLSVPLFLAMLPCLATLGGCATSPLATPPVVTRHPLSLRALPARLHIPTPAQTAMAQIQRQPLYQQAQQACKARQFQQAAALLHRLKTLPGLSAQAVAFVDEQRALCLHDAGLPAPPHIIPAPPVLPSLPPARSPDAVDCGPRALRLACADLGVKADLTALRQAAGTTEEGTSLAGLAQAAKGVGLQAEGVQVSRDALPDVEMPALAYVNGNHFVAVLAVMGRGESATARIHDPNKAAEETISQERLLRLCSGYLLLLHR